MTEIWKDIQGYEDFYQISNLGRVKSLERKITNNKGISYKSSSRIRKLVPDKDGYLLCSLSKEGEIKMIKVHREVAKAFIINFTNHYQINHIDGDKTNNKVNNLEWVDNRSNQNHRYKLSNKKLPRGVTQTDSGKYRTRITINKIQYLLYNGECSKEASRLYEESLENWENNKITPDKFIKKYESKN